MEARKVGKKSKRSKNLKSPDLSDDDDKMSIEDEEIDCTTKKQAKGTEDDWEDEEITVEFEFYEPNPTQFFSIKSLINGYLDGLSYRSSDLAQLIIEQKDLGTMIGTADDEEEENTIKNMPKDKTILGFATLMSFQQYHKQKVFEEIIKYVEEKSKKHNDRHDEFIKILHEKNVGLLINERFFQR
jgi:protein BCP1